MQFTILNTPALRSELNFLRGAMEAKPTQPALSNFCFDFLDNNLVKILSTDMELASSTIVECKSIAKKESGLINAKKLVELLADLPNNAECLITQLDTSWIELKSGKSKYRIAGQSREDFPSIEKFDLSSPIELPAIKFAQLISNTQIAITTEDSQRFALNGAQLRLENDNCTMIATDGHRLALSAFPFAHKEVTKVLIPKKALQQIKLMIDSVTGEKVPDFFLSYSENQLCFQLGDKTLYTRTLSGQFPNYTLVLPSDNTITKSILINTQELRSAVKRVSKMSESKTPGVKLFFGVNSLGLEAQDQAIGKGEECIEIVNNTLFDLGLNSNYFMDFLNKCETKELRMKFKDSLSQCLLVPENNEVNYKYVIMPMRI